MSISIRAPLKRLDQKEFKTIAHEVMRVVVDVHCELGRFFDEIVYQRAVAERIPYAQTETQIDVSFRDYHKSYFMDLVVGDGAVFELKAVEQLTKRHRSQLLNYLLLAELAHGKLVNFRAERVQHEFVNATMPRSERSTFDVQHPNWHETEGLGCSEKDLVVELLSDWGTGLDLALYEETFVHFFAGYGQVQVELDGSVLVQQTTRLCAPHVGLKVTTLNHDLDAFERHARCFLHHTSLKTMQWINIGRREVTFTTVESKNL